jgi:preprotein translocase subunit YajC
MLLHSIYLLLAMAGAPAPANGAAPAGGAANPISDMLLPVGLTVLIIYFLMLRPQQQKAAAQKKLLEGIKKGDYVLAQAGFYGRVIDVEKKALTVEIAPNVRIKMLREAVAALDRPEDEAPQK